jgi:hypothetical protein
MGSEIAVTGPAYARYGAPNGSYLQLRVGTTGVSVAMPWREISYSREADWSPKDAPHRADEWNRREPS